MEEKIVDEQPTQNAPAPANEPKPAEVVETKPEATLTPEQAQELIKAAEDATKLAEKKTKDAEHYRVGMMKYKNLLEENGIEEEEEKPVITREEIAQIVAEAVKSAIPPKTEDDELSKAENKIEEMRLAMTNRVGSPTSSGTNMDKPEVKTSAFSPEQEAEIKAKYPHLSIEEIKKNLKIEGVNS